jgi:hypothetical protein
MIGTATHSEVKVSLSIPTNITAMKGLIVDPPKQDRDQV